MIEQTGTVYRTRKLPCGDYAWLWRCEGVERTLPFLLERKRAGTSVCFFLCEDDGLSWLGLAEGDRGTTLGMGMISFLNEWCANNLT